MSDKSTICSTAAIPLKPELLHLNYRAKNAFVNYLRFYSENKSGLFWAFVFFVIKYSPMWVTPIVTANIINTVEHPHADTVWVILEQLIIGAVVILQNVPFHTLYIHFFSQANRAVEMRLRSSLCMRLQHLSIPYHKNSKMGTLQTKILRDVENIEQLTRMLIDSIPGIVISCVVALTVTAMRAPRFLLFLVAIVPVAIIISKLTIKKMIQYNSDFRHSIEDMSGKVIEMLRLISVTRAHSVERFEIDRINKKLRSVRDIGLKLDMLSAIFGSTNWAAFMLFNLITLAAAAYMNAQGMIKIGLGDIVLLTSYFNTISNSIMQVMNLIPAVSKGFESVKSITEVLECPDIEMNESKPSIHSLEGTFKFEHVTFKYDACDEKEQNAVEDFSLEVKKGETIAIVGPSGSGKSTIMQLLVGFIRPTQGRILVDNYDMNEIDLRSYRRFISVVSQESILFDGTIRENITYGAPEDTTDAEVDAAVKNSNLNEFVKSLPEGLETLVKENGARLSGGQKQRIAIARALLRNPKALLLDEATSALDVESEAMIQSALDHLIKGRTTFIVAHRLSTIRNADRIIVLVKGRITEHGTHEELMKLGGTYYRMNLLQSKTVSGDEAAKIGRELEIMHS